MHNFGKFKTWLLMGLICMVLGCGKTALANDIILNDLNGQAVQLSGYKGKPVIMLFWTTWCPYCRQEIKNLNEQHAQLEKDGIVALGVNVNEPDYKVKKFFKDYQLNFKILLDKSGLLADEYNLLGVPTYIFLDKTGEVILQANKFPDDYKSLLCK